MWGKKTGKRAAKPGDLTAFIDEGSEIEGRCSFAGTVMLNGKLQGEITSADTVIVGETAVVRADVRAETIVVSGQVVGNLVAARRLELRGTARVAGDVEAPVLVMEEGVVFQGHCKMTPKASAAPRDLSVVRGS